MKSTLGQVTALLLSAAILLMGNGLQSTLLPLRAQFETFSTFEIGILGSAYYIGFAAGCLGGPRLIRRVGHIRAFTAMVAIASVMPLAHSMWSFAAFWWLCRGFTGFCLATLFMIIESWLNEKATNENRGTIFSTYTILNLTVMTVGQLSVNLSDLHSFFLFSLASIMVSLAAVPLSITRASAPAPIQRVKVRIGHLFRISPVGIIGAFLVGAQQGAFWSLGPVFADRIGLTTFWITLFMSLTILGGALGQWPLGKLSDRLDRRKVLVGVALLAAIIGVSIRFLNPTLGHGILIFGFLWGMLAMPLYSICAAHMNDHVKEGQFVEASSGLLLVFAGGAVLGPIIVSPFMTTVTPYALFAWTALFQILMACWALYRMTIRGAVAEEDRTEFTDALTEVSTVLSMSEDRAGTDKGAAEPEENGSN